MSESAPGTIALKQWNATALWAWDIQADVCSICRNLVMVPCLDCTGKPNCDCTISWGECMHAFHTHCLQRWLKIRSACPVDNTPWQLKRVCSPNEQ